MWMEFAGSRMRALRPWCSTRLFEEQLRQEEADLDYHHGRGHGEFCRIAHLLSAGQRVSHRARGISGITFARRKRQSRIPIIASLNGSTLGGWTKFASEIEQSPVRTRSNATSTTFPTDPKLTAADVEKTYLDILRAVKAAVKIPVAIKLSPFFSNMANMAHRLDEAGADALVLFNRFYQPDIDLEELEIRPNVLLSTPQALRLAADLDRNSFRPREGRPGGRRAACTTPKTPSSCSWLGANVTMMCSSLMRHGVNHVRHVERELREWMEEHEYESVKQMQGSMSQIKCADPAEFERAQYMRAVKGMQHIHMAGLM
jgi:dihydroorotate dehydrogenase (fumarate)